MSNKLRYVNCANTQQKWYPNEKKTYTRAKKKSQQNSNKCVYKINFIVAVEPPNETRGKSHITSSFNIIAFICFCFVCNWTFFVLTLFSLSTLPVIHSNCYGLFFVRLIGSKSQDYCLQFMYDMVCVAVILCVYTLHTNIYIFIALQFSV